MKTKGHALLPTLALSVSLLATGCMVDMKPSGRKFNKEALVELKEGVTTEAEILKLIGEPMSKVRNSDGSAQFTYFYATSKFQAFNPLDYGQDNIKQTSVIIFTNAQGKYVKYIMSGNQ